MCKFFIMAAAACALLSASTALAGDRQLSKATEHAIEALISQWAEAYQNLDAKRLVAHETTKVEVVDRFSQLCLPSSTSENEKLWSDTFEMISRKSTPPTVTVDHIDFLRPEIAQVQASWQFSEGILPVDGYRIPPFLQVDTYVVIKTQGVWLVAAHNMHETKP